jgi:hypothetical protein
VSAKCEKQPAQYLLSLTEDEARAVCVALGHFGGGADDQTEAVFDAIHEALGDGTDYLRYFEIVYEPGCVPYIARKTEGTR